MTKHNSINNESTSVKSVISEYEIDGSQAHSFVHNGYLSACILNCEAPSFSCSDITVVFPDYNQAAIAASWANNPNLGGYINVTVKETNLPSNFKTAEAWFFEEKTI
jgi:hypothetical protein